MSRSKPTTNYSFPFSDRRILIAYPSYSEIPITPRQIQLRHQACTNQVSQDSLTQQELAELCMKSTISHLPASDQRLDVYRKQSNDPICQQISKYCLEGWPNKNQLDVELKPYWDAQGELTEGNGVLMYGQRMVVPKPLQAETLQKIHEGQQGITRCRLRAKMSVWWRGLSKQLKSYVEKCPECAKDVKPSKEPLIPTSLPAYPWQKVTSMERTIL